MALDKKIIANKYEIRHKIASGAFGTVYLALHEDLDRLVAIKGLHAHYSQEPNFRSRFLREAKALAKLHHENIVGIYDILEEDGIYYIVMEYVDGISLDDYVVKKGHLSVVESVEIALQIAKGLDHAHQFNIVHRDIKPPNILLDKNNRVKITDFGIVAAAGEANLTQVGQVVGTPRYMSPEQACGEDVDARSDIYSLGIVFYQMLSGKNLFEGMSSSQVMRELFTDEEKYQINFQGQVPESVQILVLSMLEKNREKRIESCYLVILRLTSIYNQLESNKTQILEAKNTDEIEDESTIIATPNWGINQGDLSEIDVKSSINDAPTIVANNMDVTRVMTPEVEKAPVSKFEIIPNLQMILSVIIVVGLAIGILVYYLYTDEGEDVADILPPKIEEKRAIEISPAQKSEIDNLKNKYHELKAELENSLDSTKRYETDYLSMGTYLLANKYFNDGKETAKKSLEELSIKKYQTTISHYNQAISELNDALINIRKAKTELEDQLNKKFIQTQQTSNEARNKMLLAKDVAEKSKARVFAISKWKIAEETRKKAEQEEKQGAELFDSGELKPGIDAMINSSEIYVQAQDHYKSSVEIAKKKILENKERERKRKIAIEEKKKRQSIPKEPKKTDYQIVSVKLKDFERAFKSRNITAINEIANLSPDRKRFVKSIFEKFQIIEISISSLELVSGVANATITIDHLIDANNEATIPGKNWKTFTLTATRTSKGWGKLEW